MITVKYIQKRKQSIVEGELRCEELVNYLDKLGAPKKVWLSEDGSGIISKVTYDAGSNQLIGLVLPINNKTGMPTVFSFAPQSVKEIEQQMKHYPESTLVYLILAQPILKKAPPFILQVFGTDNKFKTKDVLLRWRHTKDQLARYCFFLRHS